MNTDPEFEENLRDRLRAEASRWRGPSPWPEQARYARAASGRRFGATGRARMLAIGGALGAALLGGAVIAAAEGGVRVPFTEIRIGPAVTDEHAAPVKGNDSQIESSPAAPAHVVVAPNPPGHPQVGAGAIVRPAPGDDQHGSGFGGKPDPSGRHPHPSPRPSGSPDPYDDGGHRQAPQPSPSAHGD
jgi:hypothetical protein